jgi:hypothetical protein
LARRSIFRRAALSTVAGRYRYHAIKLNLQIDGAFGMLEAANTEIAELEQRISGLKEALQAAESANGSGRRQRRSSGACELNRAARRDEPIASYREVRWPKSRGVRALLTPGGSLARTIRKRTQANRRGSVERDTLCRTPESSASSWCGRAGGRLLSTRICRD